MRRTRFNNNVVNLATARKHDKLKKHKARREQEREARDYRVGLMVCVDQYELVPMEKALCDTLAANYRPGSKVPLSVMMELHKLIGRLLMEQSGLTLHVVNLSNIKDGGSRKADTG